MIILINPSAVHVIPAQNSMAGSFLIVMTALTLCLFLSQQIKGIQNNKEASSFILAISPASMSLHCPYYEVSILSIASM